MSRVSENNLKHTVENSMQVMM